MPGVSRFFHIGHGGVPKFLFGPHIQVLIVSRRAGRDGACAYGTSDSAVPQRGGALAVYARGQAGAGERQRLAGFVETKRRWASSIRGAVWFLCCGPAVAGPCGVLRHGQQRRVAARRAV